MKPIQIWEAREACLGRMNKEVEFGPKWAIVSIEFESVQNLSLKKLFYLLVKLEICRDRLGVLLSGYKYKPWGSQERGTHQYNRTLLFPAIYFHCRRLRYFLFTSSSGTSRVIRSPGLSVSSVFYRIILKLQQPGASLLLRLKIFNSYRVNI